MKYTSFLTAVVLMFLTGCSSIGPKAVPRDRFDYNTAIADSWKEQTLLNVVRLRYSDMPVFVEVASVVSGYTLEGSVNLGGTVSSENAIQGDFLALGTSGKYTDRPTITYSPITGEKFNRNFLTHIPPKLILFLLEAGYPAEWVFPLVVKSINGLLSGKEGGMASRVGDPGFYRATSLIQIIQYSGYANMAVLKGKGADENTYISIRRDILPPEVNEALKEFEKLLGLRPGSNELLVSYRILPKTDQEIAIQTRSMLQAMMLLSAQIDVPSSHIENGLTFPTLSPSGSTAKKMGHLIKVHTTTDKPEGAFASVRYKDNWFWIDDGDLNSKRIFTFLMILFSVAETGGKQDLPLVTIPAG